MITAANIADLWRPVEKMSFAQQIAIASTGVIWSRYATQIVPVNYNLLTVNTFMAVTGLWHVGRIVKYRMGADAAAASVPAQKTR